MYKLPTDLLSYRAQLKLWIISMVLVHLYPQFKGYCCLGVHIPVVSIFVTKLVLLSRNASYSTGVTFFEKKNQNSWYITYCPFQLQGLLLVFFQLFTRDVQALFLFCMHHCISLNIRWQFNDTAVIEMRSGVGRKSWSKLACQMKALTFVS